MRYRWIVFALIVGALAFVDCQEIACPSGMEMYPPHVVEPLPAERRTGGTDEKIVEPVTVCIPRGSDEGPELVSFEALYHGVRLGVATPSTPQ